MKQHSIAAFAKKALLALCQLLPLASQAAVVTLESLDPASFNTNGAAPHVVSVKSFAPDEPGSTIYVTNIYSTNITVEQITANYITVTNLYAINLQGTNGYFGMFIGNGTSMSNAPAYYDGTNVYILGTGGSTIYNSFTLPFLSDGIARLSNGVLTNGTISGGTGISATGAGGTNIAVNLTANLAWTGLHTYSANIGAVLAAGPTNYVDVKVASATNNLASTMTFAHATNGVAGQEWQHVRKEYNNSGSAQTINFNSSWHNLAGSSVTISNNTIAWVYITALGDTSSAALQTNVFSNVIYWP